MFGEINFDGQYAYIPDRMKEAILAYVHHRKPLGHFLSAVICNDLREAIGRADEENLALLKVYVQWFYNVCPANLVGRENYVAHISKKDD